MVRLCLVLFIFLCGCSSAPHADVVFVNGTFHTVNPKQPKATVVAARQGVICYVGDDSSAGGTRTEETRVVDLGGGFAYPGLTDAHMHLEGVGKQAMQLDLIGCEGIGDLVRRLSDKVARTADGQWIVGRGWIETFWKPRRFPTRYDLDTVSPNHPVLLTRIDGHGAVVNTRALELAGIDASTEDPPGGEIHRADDGTPIGMLIDNAIGLVSKHIPETTSERRREALRAGAALYVSRGWAGVHIAGMSHAALRDTLDLVETGEIDLRVYATLFFEDPQTEGLDELLDGDLEVSRRFTKRGIKVSYDGALGSRGAGLLEPYCDAPHTHGLIKHSDDEMRQLLVRALKAGVQIQVHAIGDRANRKILDLFEWAFDEVPLRERAQPEPRWRVEHAQVLTESDIGRFAELGVIASMQPSHAISDLHFAPARLGPDRLGGAYAWRKVLDEGGLIAGGSDAPVEVGDPRVEFYAATARRDLRGFQGEGWHPELAVKRDEALRMFTEWAAVAAFEEHWRGSLEVGKVCDLSVFNVDWLTAPIDRVPTSKCLMTVVDGEVVYRATGS